jgi:GAF domain-containing protein
MIFCRNVQDRVIEEKKPLVHSDIKSGEDELADTLKAMRIQSVLWMPMLMGSDVIGVIYLDSLEKPYGFRKEDVSLFVDLSRRTALAL